MGILSWCLSYKYSGKTPRNSKKGEKNKKTPKNGYFISSESQKSHLSEKSFRVLSSKVKRLSLIGVSAKMKKIGPLYLYKICYKKNLIYRESYRSVTDQNKPIFSSFHKSVRTCVRQYCNAPSPGHRLICLNWKI